MKTKIATLCLLISSFQAHALSTDLISCSKIGHEASYTLTVSETKVGFGFIVDVKPIFFSHETPYHSEGPIRAQFNGENVMKNFETDNEVIFNPFLGITYQTKDRSRMIDFEQKDCTLANGTRTVRGIGESSLNVLSCGAIDIAALTTQAQNESATSASLRCSRHLPIKITDYNVEVTCQDNSAHATVSAMYRCLGVAAESTAP